MKPTRLPQDVRLDRRELVAPDHLEERISASWGAIAARLPAEQRAPRRAPWVALGVALAAAGLLVARLGLEEPETRPLPPLASRPAAAPAAPVEETRVEASPDAELALLEDAPREARYRLRKGRATFAALGEQAKPLVIDVADDVRVRVAHSRVTVLGASAARPYVEVFVEAGSAVVEVGDEQRTLGAGETFRSRRPQAHRSEPRSAPAPEVAQEDDARQRLARASEARRQGRYAESAAQYERLLVTFPGDARAPLAALELGRLRADELGDPAGAIVALERAARRDAPDTIREDALARLVAAHDARGDRTRCEAARARYRKAFPHGLHMRDVERRCSGAP